jgi:ABC-2 type transport system ATP-binding protein
MSFSGPGSTKNPNALAEFVGAVRTYSAPLPWRRPIQAVRGVSFHVNPGEVFGLLGPNRAGKTTLVKMLLTLTRPTGGTVLRLGKPVNDRSTLADVGYVHESHAFPRYLTARNLLHYYGSLSLVPPKELKTRVPALLEKVGLADRSEEPIAQFSKGMLQRLGLAQALINAPRLLVLDEPTEGLDLSGRQLMRSVIEEVRAAKGAVLLVSHALSEVEPVCDRVGVIVSGELVHLGPLSGLAKPLEKSLAELYARKPASVS